MNKPELQKQCEEAGIEFTEEHTKAQLQEMLDNKALEGKEIVHTESGEVVTVEEAAADLGVNLSEEGVFNSDEEDDLDEDYSETEEEDVELEEGEELVHLKLAKRHPKHSMRVGHLVVEGYQYKPYVINEAIAEELMQVGCRHWISIKEEQEE